MLQQNHFFIFATLFLIGCLLGLYFNFEPLYFAIILFFLATLSLVVNNRLFLILCFASIVFLVGFLRSGIIQDESVIFDGVYNKEVLVSGYISGDIETREKSVRYVFKIEELDGKEVSSKILVYEPFPSGCHTGEEVSFLGRIKQPENFLSNTGRIVDYGAFLRQKGVYGIVFLQEGICDGIAEKFIFFSEARKFLVNSFSSIIPSPESSLLAGLLLGLRNSMPKELLEAFRITGLIHIIVLSGYNVTIVAETVRRGTIFLSRYVGLIIAVLTVILFVILAGADVVAIRAGAMAVIALIARAIKREGVGLRALVLVACGIVFLDPENILFNTSFHLSFLATAGLLLYSPFFENKLSFITDRFQIRSIISATLSTQLFLLPYLGYKIGEVSVVGFVTNVLALPLIPFAMGTGMILALLNLVSNNLATVFLPIAYAPLHAIILIAETFSTPTYASIALPPLSGVLIILLYLVLFLMSSSSYQKKSHK